MPQLLVGPQCPVLCVTVKADDTAAPNIVSAGGTDSSDFISGKNIVVSDDFDLVSDTISDIFLYNVTYTLNITVVCVKALKSENIE